MKFEITLVEPAFGGSSFGEVGAYEKVTGIMRGALDPADPRNAGIVNLEHAPTNASGLVEYECDFTLLRPADLSRGNGAMLYDVVNRGNKVALHSLNDSPRDAENPAAMAVNAPSSAGDAGNGFLMRHGFSILWSGWQGAGVMGGDNLMAARLPIAKNKGQSIIGTSREEYIFEHPKSPVIAPLSYPAASRNISDCTLTIRQREGDVRTEISTDDWRFISDTEIEIDRPDGFDASAIYEFIYEARDPIIMGMGFAAVRDCVAFMRGAEGLLTMDGKPAITRALSFGMSQAGRFLRDFVHQGFNEDLAGNIVFDGMLASMAGSRKTFTNYAFAQSGRFSRQHEDRLFPHDQFPFSYATTTDPISGKTDGIFEGCSAETRPKVMQTESSSDFFHGRASLLVTDGQGAEIPIPDGVRFYHFASAQHGGGRATANYARNFPFTKYQLNPVDFSGVHRALLLALDRWIVDSTSPPPSQFPNPSDGTLVSAEAETYGFPDIPGVTYPGLVNGLCALDYAVQPPQPIAGQDYAVSVPAIDADGNETAGIRVPEIMVPRGTHTGWAPRKAGYAEGELVALGAYFPFAATKAERLASGDPRGSLEERYPSPDNYIGKISQAAHALCAQGLLLSEDVERIIAEARERD